MIKRFISLLTVVMLFMTTMNMQGVSAEETNKGDTAEFYLEMRDKVQLYFEELESGKITEDEFVEKVETNIGVHLETEEDLAELIESESKAIEAESQMIEAQSKNDFYFDKFGVKAQEVYLIKLYPVAAIQAKNLADKATKSAKDRYRKYTLHQGNGDAYRHAYWSALMTKHIGRNLAWRFGYAHEGHDTGTYHSISSLDDKMDLRNNHLGRIDGTNWKKHSDKTIGNKIADSISKGKKVRIRTWTSKKTNDKKDGVPTNYVGKFVPTSKGGRHH
ncbi:DUF6973 domain-containing protein [Shouchella lonarensis]|uniref:DUF6973 domain-containing protein n=1 Tax=Shouchella lonarensis TaxID=1464122 RepID=A0A1G6P1D5_9BACI|nr:hypothetical protein [Shouchella lonarensis]SDC73316.1 hypothetical protein SAMN05421737_11428 [Shouchella lonarensis]